MAKKAQRSVSSSATSVPPQVAKQSLWIWLTSIAILMVGLWQSIALRWVSDDAFITFRYVKNFVDGKGIVYNAGEYVEGYTHFLWLLILSFVRWLGFDQVNASMWLGICWYAILLAIYLSISKKEHDETKVFYVPLAAALIALHYDMQIWATGGLETVLYTLWISLAFYLWFYTTITDSKKLLIVGSILILATLTRPDGALFIIIAILLLTIKSFKDKDSLSLTAKRIGLLILPAVIICIPYLLWKYNYYGDIFPNTYYTKSADESYFGQGFFYIWLFFKVYFSVAIGLILFGIALFLRKYRAPLSTVTHSVGSPIAAAIVGVVLYLIIYVARVGGDFMFGRFIIPVLPLMYYLLERFVSRLPKPWVKYSWLVSLVFIGSLLFENHYRERVLIHVDAKTGQDFGNWDDTGGGETHGIADERWVYMRNRMQINGVFRSSIDIYSEIGRFYEPFFKGLPITVATNGAQNMIAYYADFDKVIDVYGLTDAYISHLPITKRGRIGHEKKAPDSYFEERGVHFQLFAIVPKLPPQVPFNMIVFEIPGMGLYQIAKIITYDKELMKEVRRRFNEAGFKPRLPQFEKVLPVYIEKYMPTLSIKQVEEDYEGFKKLYFSRYPDPETERKIQDYIASKEK